MTRALRRFFARLLAKLRGADVAIPTFVSGNILTAAQLNTISTAFPIVDGWTSYTPTLTQSATVTKTVTRAAYAKFGRMVHVDLVLDITGAGTASNAVLIGLPPFVPASTSGKLPWGQGFLVDISLTNVFPFFVTPQSTTEIRLASLGGTVGTSPSLLGAAVFTAALANTDWIACSFAYESTT